MRPRSSVNWLKKQAHFMHSISNMQLLKQFPMAPLIVVVVANYVSKIGMVGVAPSSNNFGGPKPYRDRWKEFQI